jgi:hypothetical protein
MLGRLLRWIEEDAANGDHSLGSHVIRDCCPFPHINRTLVRIEELGGQPL